MRTLVREWLLEQRLPLNQNDVKGFVYYGCPLETLEAFSRCEPDRIGWHQGRPYPRPAKWTDVAHTRTNSPVAHGTRGV
jgi:hypothetical protein